ncbi:MAG: DUF4365 domain-containing protein [Dehalococcoidia bacterium]|nr:DUF4365 domain-containing protein [Dehalococcoidia bacterium]
MSLKLSKFPWHVVPSNNRDEGTDLYVTTSDANRHGVLGVQVKTGPSYFRRPKLDGEGVILGWWYYESSRRHFDYWTSHSAPHILVLYDEEADTAYWVHVTPDKVVSTGKGCKILVPAERKVDGDHRNDLLAVTHGRGSSPTLEGTAFWAGARNIAPEEQLRCALIAPRLVAPHRNAGNQKPITAVEAVALLAQGRFRALVAFAEEHPDVPDPREEPPEGGDWAWSFTAAIWDWATTDSVDRLRASFASAPGGREKAASGIFFACALQRVQSHGEGVEPQTRHSEALAVLDELVDGGDLGASDLGWVLVQRARSKSEAGQDEEAESDAGSALTKFVDQRDVTTTALAAAARATAWGIVAARDFQEADLGSLITASDNAVSWWRSQAISEALTSAASTHFNTWAEKRYLMLTGGNAADDNLFAAELNADLLGDQGIFGHVASLKARQRMMSAASSRDEVAELIEGLDALRGSGDESSLESAIVHLRRAGPIEAAANSVNKISPDEWTRTTAGTNFSALRLAGDLVEEATASDLLLSVTRLAAGETTDYEKLVLRSVLVEHSVFGAAAGLMRSASTSTHQAVARMIGALPRPQLDHSVSRLPDVIWQLDFDQVPVPERSALSELGWSDQGRLGIAVLGWLAANKDTDALGELRRRAVSGDLAALDGLGLQAIDEAEAASIIERLAGIVTDTISSARKGTLSIGGRDNSGTLTRLNFLFPKLAMWDPIVELLCEPRVLEDDKLSPCYLVVETPDQLPEEPRNRLAGDIDSIGKAVRAFGRPSDSGMGVAISIALGVASGGDADTAIARLVSGSPQHRQAAALLLGSGYRSNMQPVLAALAGDTHFEVRRTAAEAVGKLAGVSPSPQIDELARHLVAHRGTDLPEALLIGLGQHDQVLSGTGVEIAQRLEGSPSARVRHSAQRLLSRQSSQQATPS